MKVTYTTEKYTPSKELNNRLLHLAYIAAAAKQLGQESLFSKTQQEHDKLVSQYNSVANTKKKGFWGQVWDNMTNTTTHVETLDYLVSSNDYLLARQAMSGFSPNQIEQFLKSLCNN